MILAAANPEIDTVVFAFGTNDAALLIINPALLFIDPSPIAIADEIEALVIAAQAAGLEAYAATVPPRFDLPGSLLQTHINAINFVLRDRGLALIDFDTGFDESDFLLDGVHLTALGQVKRAERVLETLPEPRVTWPTLLVLAGLARRRLFA